MSLPATLARGAAATVPTDIVAWWPAEDHGLDVAGGLNALPLGAPGFTGGVVGRAFAFDGVSGRFVTFEDDKADLTGDLTIEGWINIAGTSSGTRTIIMKPSGNGQDVCYSLVVDGAGKLAFSSTTAGSKTEIRTVAVLPVDTDIHVAVTLLAGDLRIYLDGAQTAHLFFGTSRPATDVGVVLGATITGAVTSGYFAGEIDELAVYKRALTATEIAAIHTAGAAGKAREDAARNFDAWAAGDTTQQGRWRYGTVQPETTAGTRPDVTTFAALTTGEAANGLSSWTGTTPLRITGNSTGAAVTGSENSTTQTFYPGALTLRPGTNGAYAALEWTAPATGDYAFSVLFAGADSQPTDTYVRVLYQNEVGVLTVVPKNQLQGSYASGSGNTVTQWSKLPLAAGEKLYFLVGDGANTDPATDSTAVFASIIPVTTAPSNDAPTVTTAAASAVTSTTATLNGTITPNGLATTYFFEYGPTTSYGKSTASQSAGSGTSAVNVSANLTGLTAASGYHFRLVASNTGGTVNGSDLQFTTPQTPADFTVEITDLKPGDIVSGAAKLVAAANVKIPRGSKTKIANVQFYVDNQPVGAPVTRARYKFAGTIGATGPHTIGARATDTQGRFVDSASVNFTVAPASAGPLALTSSLSPSGTAKPGDLLTYTLVARNSSDTGSKNVELSLLVPVGSGYVDTRFVDANGQPIPTPRGTTISFNGANGTVTVKIPTVNAFTTVRLQLLARVPFDQTTTGNAIVSSAFTLNATQVKNNFNASFTPRSVTVNGSLPAGTARPVLGLFVAQSAAGELPANPSIVTVTKADRRLGVPGAKPARTSNQIVYRIHFANYGNAPARSVRIVAPVPPGTTYKARSASVITAKGDSIPVFEPVLFGNLLFFEVPSLEAGYFTGNLGSAKTLLYTVNVNDDQEIGDEIVHEGAAVTSGELLTPVTTNTRKLARVVAPEQMTYAFTRQIAKATNQAVDSAEGTVFHTIYYANQGGLAAKEVGVRYTIPAGLAFQSARFVDHRGLPLKRQPAQPTTPSVGATSGNVTFPIGTVGAGKRGAVQVVLKLDPTSRPAQVRKTESLFVGYDSTTATPSAPPPRTAKTRAATAPGSQPSQSGSIPQQAYDPGLSRLFILQSAPAAVAVLNEFDVVLTWGNLSPTPSGSGSMIFPIPEGTEFVSASDSAASFGNQSIAASYNATNPEFPNGVVVWTLGPLGHSALAATIRLRVKAGVTGALQLNQASANFDLSIAPVFAAPLRIRVVPAGLPIASYRAEVYRSVVGAGSDISVGSAASPNTKFVQNVEAIGDGSLALSIAGADYAHIAAAGGVVIPLGNNRMVAAGGGNFINQNTASMVAAGGGNLVAAGAGNMQVDVPGSGFLTGTQLIATAPSLVAAGGLNLVAAGGLNLIRKAAELIGNDGSTLIGNDGSTLIGMDGSTLGTFSQRVGLAGSFKPTVGNLIPLTANVGSMVAAGGGNLVAAGGGNLVSAGAGNIMPPFALVGNDGASVIARDGASLIGDYSAGLIGNDGSTLIGNDGSTLVAAGGGNFVSSTTGLVAAGGLNNQ